MPEQGRIVMKIETGRMLAPATIDGLTMLTVRKPSMPMGRGVNAMRMDPMQLKGVTVR